MAWVAIDAPDGLAVCCATAPGLGTVRLEYSDDAETWVTGQESAPPTQQTPRQDHPSRETSR